MAIKHSIKYLFSCFYGFVNINYQTVVKISYTTIIGHFKYTVSCNKYSEKYIFCYIFYTKPTIFKISLKMMYTDK